MGAVYTRTVERELRQRISVLEAELTAISVRFGLDPRSIEEALEREILLRSTQRMYDKLREAFDAGANAMRDRIIEMMPHRRTALKRISMQSLSENRP